MDRRKYIALTGTALTTATAGCSETDDDDSEPDQEPETEQEAPEEDDETEEEPADVEDDDVEEEVEEEEEPEEVEETELQSFSGDGATVEQDISIEGGLTVVDANHDGESNFQVSLVDDTEFDESFVNEIGEYDGETADLIDGGEYMLEVEADGSWEIEIRQPRAASGDDLPQSLSSSGPEVHGPIEFTGSHVAEGSHDGESNYSVNVYPGEGSFGELLFNEIGEYEGETTFSFEGVGWVAVQADGDWTVDLD